MKTTHYRTFLLLGACALGSLAPNVPFAESATAVKVSTTLKKVTRLVPFGSVPVLSTDGSLLLAARFSKSMKSRRDFAWKVVSKVFEPVDVSSTSYTGKLPLWHTWYEEDDFRDVYATLLKSRASLRAPTIATQVSKIDSQTMRRRTAILRATTAAATKPSRSETRSISSRASRAGPSGVPIRTSKRPSPRRIASAATKARASIST